MDNDDILLCRAILKALKAVGANGLTPDLIRDHAELAIGRPLTTQEHGAAIEHLERDRKWIQSYRHEVTKQVRYTITPSGAVALMGL